MKQVIKEMKYSLYIMVHPFKGFWDLKHEHEGSFRSAMLLVALAILCQIVSDYFTEYLFNNVMVDTYNLLSTAAIGCGLFFAWCIANWSFTCLAEGEGTMKDIMTAVGYCLAPYIIMTIIRVPLSYYFIQREAAMYDLLMNIGLLWTGMLIVFATLVVHQYSFAKTLIVCVLTIVGICVMLYVGILFFNLVQAIAAFVTDIINEIRIVTR